MIVSETLVAVIFRYAVCNDDDDNVTDYIRDRCNPKPNTSKLTVDQLSCTVYCDANLSRDTTFIVGKNFGLKYRSVISNDRMYL
jgi:hypothetical protein